MDFVENKILVSDRIFILFQSGGIAGRTTFRERMGNLTSPKDGPVLGHQRRRISKITESRARSWLHWRVSDITREQSRLESKLNLAVGASATKMKFDCSEIARNLISCKIETIEAAISLNEAPDLESALQTHLNSQNSVVETVSTAFQLILSIIERVDQKKPGGGPDKENVNRYHGNNSGTGGPNGSGNQGGGACYLCGSKFHWVRQCPERRT